MQSLFCRRLKVNKSHLWWAKQPGMSVHWHQDNTHTHTPHDVTQIHPHKDGTVARRWPLLSLLHCAHSSSSSLFMFHYMEFICSAPAPAAERRQLGLLEFLKDVFFSWSLWDMRARSAPYEFCCFCLLDFHPRCILRLILALGLSAAANLNTLLWFYVFSLVVFLRLWLVCLIGNILVVVVVDLSSSAAQCSLWNVIPTLSVRTRGVTSLASCPRL